MVSFSLFIIVVICLFHLMIGLFVLLTNKRDRTNQLFFAFVLSIIGWLITNYFSDDGTFSHTIVDVFNVAVFEFPVIAAYFVLLFSLLFTGKYSARAPWQKVAIVLGTGTMMIVSGTKLLVDGLLIKGHNVYGIVYGPATPFYFAYLLIYFGLVIIIFIRALRQSTGAKRTRIRYILAGILASFSVAIVTNLLLPFITHDFSLDTLGPFSTLFLVGGISYAIVKHRLFDIRVVVARSVAFVVLIAVLAVAYGVVIFGASVLLFPGKQLDAAQSVIFISLSLLMAVTFQSLRRTTERLTDNIFFRNRYDSQDVINNFSKILVSELDLSRILKKALTELCEQLHIQFGQILVYNNDRVYRIEHFGPLPQRLMVAPELAKLDHSMLIADELPIGERKTLMDQHGIRISMALRTREESVGYLLLGDKLSGDIYSNQDIEILEIIGKELAVAVLNAKAYAQIQEFNLTLQARIDHATGRLRVANRHLKELDRAKDEFISMASHQLRTPLTTIKGYLSMMLEGDAGRLTAPQKEFVGYAFGSSERMVNLISDLLNVSRLSAGRFLIQTKPTDMVQMVADEVRQLETHASGKGIKLIFNAPPEKLPPAQIDENKTRQVIMNFIDNAIYYTQKGEVRVVLDQTPERVRLEVRDSGIGVPDAAKRKLFSKFFRADNAQTVRPDGTGLGLYLAKRVVEDQGGTIIFSSTEGKGSTFGFELPTKPTAATSEDKHGRSK
ncbi:MAG TPA: ATP-binding protein [Candidatus Saccharimonadia bacterium]|nr:ATP-binding protein [Candidatus Saccharimonadia bacterium]